jgi:hypothetical protein
MRFRRLSFVAGWAAIAVLAAVGLAAFGISDSNAPETNVDAAAASMGHTTGAYAGLSFALLALTLDDISETSDPGPSSLDDRTSQTLARSTEEKSNGTIASEASGWLSEVEVRALVSNYFNAEDVNKAIRIAWCESRFNPQSVNLRTGATGMFQHLPRYWEKRSTAAGFPGAELTDPEASIAAAAWAVYNGGGWDVFACRD